MKKSDGKLYTYIHTLRQPRCIFHKNGQLWVLKKKQKIKVWEEGEGEWGRESDRHSLM